ncbi:hypothetical protein OIU78_013076 [Salix suchowensis]|nr:hypothetical protein OIU78_013076 [Salix suchowensis]
MDNGPLEASDEEWKLGNASVSPDTDLKHDTRKSSAWQQNLFSKYNELRISECRSLLMITSEEISAPLQSLTGVTWTAKELHAIISGEDP